MNEIVFVTGNKGKLATAQRVFKGQIDLIGCDLDIEEPNVNDIEYISKFKVQSAYNKLHKPCIALDAGFYIPNYPGKPNFPGAFPKRELINKIGIEGLLKAMEGVSDRRCYFKECLSFYDGRELHQFWGVNHGTISLQILGGDCANKWSELYYVFIPKNCTKTLAQMTDDERANRPDGHTDAFREFANWYCNREK